MSVSGISSYNKALYQWQAQQLKSTGSSASSSTTSSLASSLFSSNNSMTSQVSSMVELTKYAMDAMGLSSGSRVTFSQISKYRQQLQNEFSEGVKQGIQESGIGNLPGISYSLDKNGVITAVGSNAADRKKAQSWLDSNPQYGLELFGAIKDAGLEIDKIDFNLSSLGKLTIIDTTAKSLQEDLNKDPEALAGLKTALSEAGISMPSNLELKFNSDGVLEASGEGNEEINAWLKENTKFADSIKASLAKYNIDEKGITLRAVDSNLQVSIDNGQNSKIQAALDKQTAVGQKIYSGLDNLGIDKNISFSIQLNDDGTYEIISDSPDKDKIVKFFNDNPDLIKKYMQVEALAGIDDARKSMQISPSEMRKRIQIESMASWWYNSSGSAASYFGQYDSGQLSLLSGLNLNV